MLSLAHLQAMKLELQKIAKDLTPEARAQIAKKNFALTSKQSDTGKPAYPIHDEQHARTALGMVGMHGTPEQKSEVYKDIVRKYPEMAAKSKAIQKWQESKTATVADSSVLKSIARHLHNNEDAYELAGLGTLGAIGLDRLQAHARAGRGADEHAIEKKQLLGESGHAALDTAGLGVLAAPIVAKKMLGH